MNPEDIAWQRLRTRAGERIGAGFPDRVLAAAKAPAYPSVTRQVALGTATALLCFLAIALFQSQTSQAEENQNLAGWQQISSSAEEAGLAQ